MKVWSLHAWVCANGGVVAGRALVAFLEQSALQWIINRLKKMPFMGKVGQVLRHPSDRPVHHRDKAFIELFIPTPNMTQSDSGIITALHDWWSRNTRFHGKWGN